MNRIGLSPALSRRHRWWPEDAVYAADFVSNRYMRHGVEIAPDQAFTFARATPRLAQDAKGKWIGFEPDHPARTNRGLHVEAEETYSPVNALFAGAVPGVVGSGGALPSGWSGYGYTRIEIVSIASPVGLPVITLDLVRDNTGGGTAVEGGITLNPAPAAPGEFWTMGLYGEVIEVFGDDDCTAPSNRLQLQERNASYGFLTNAGGIVTGFDAGDLSQRQTRTKEVVNPATAYVQMFHTWSEIKAGEYFHRRIALGMPTLTKSQTVSSPMATTNAGSVVRAADAVSLSLPSGPVDLTIAYADGSSALVSGVGEAYGLPADPAKPIVGAAAVQG